MGNVKSITTKKGDRGTSRLFSGEEVPKNSPRLEAYGDIDELVAVLGVARHHAKKDNVKEALLYIQRSLFTVAAELATTKEKINRLPKRVDSFMLEALEERRDNLEATITIPQGFVIPGDSLSAAHIDEARTITRRCERKTVGLFQNKIIDNETMLIWLNRLSDYLYLLARAEEDTPTMA